MNLEKLRKQKTKVELSYKEIRDIYSGLKLLLKILESDLIAEKYKFETEEDRISIENLVMKMLSLRDQFKR